MYLPYKRIRLDLKLMTSIIIRLFFVIPHRIRAPRLETGARAEIIYRRRRRQCKGMTAAVPYVCRILAHGTQATYRASERNVCVRGWSVGARAGGILFRESV